MSKACNTSEKDLATDRLRASILWGLPQIAFVVGILTNPSQRIALWSIGLTVAGAACLINAFRCRRLHCFFTRPFYLVMAGLTLFHGLGFIQLGTNGWYLIGLTIIIGGFTLARLPERLWGK